VEFYGKIRKGGVEDEREFRAGRKRLDEQGESHLCHKRLQMRVLCRGCPGLFGVRRLVRLVSVVNIKRNSRDK